MRYAKERPVENMREKPDIDCDTCVEKKKGCREASSGSFCTRWRSREAEKEGTDPAQAWARGDEDVVL